VNDRIILITGGNKGLGFETARRLKELGHKIWIGARDPELGAEAAKRLGVDWLALDVSDDASVTKAAIAFDQKAGRLDVLINNAGIIGARKPAGEINSADAEEVFATNLIGPVRMMNAFIPLLRNSKNPVIVNVSSGLGSFAAVHDTGRIESKVIAPLYCASKSALTMLTVQYARSLPDFRINAADPGYTATDLNGHQGPQTVEEGTDAIVRLATLPPDGPTGMFFDRHGQVPW